MAEPFSAVLPLCSHYCGVQFPLYHLNLRSLIDVRIINQSIGTILLTGIGIRIYKQGTGSEYFESKVANKMHRNEEKLKKNAKNELNTYVQDKKR